MKRIRYFDVLRVLAFGVIIIYHWLCETSAANFIGNDLPRLFQTCNNIYLVMASVTIFFMLSGAGLMLSAKEDFKAGEFYRKRLLKLYIPFWIIIAIMFIVLAVKRGTAFVSPEGTFPWKWIFTVLGIDGTLSVYGVNTYYFGVGEWFLGELLILYLLFPLFRAGIYKKPKLFFIVATVIYFLALYNPNNEVPYHLRIVAKAYEFILGMYIGKYFTKLPGKAAIVSVPLMAFMLICRDQIPLQGGLINLIFALSVFASFSFLEPFLQRHSLKFIDVIGKYSYEAYLFHHILFIFSWVIMGPYITSKTRLLIAAVIQLVAIAVVSVGVHFLADRIKLIGKKK